MKTIIIFLVSISAYAVSPSVSMQIKNNVPNSIWKKSSKYIQIIEQVGSYSDINPYLIYSLAWTETHFSPRESSAGARGVLQLMPRTESYLRKKHKKDLLLFKALNSHLLLSNNENDIDNIFLGTQYLKYLIKRFYTIKQSIVAYNMGPTWVSKRIKKSKIGYHQYYKKIARRLKRININS